MASIDQRRNEAKRLAMAKIKSSEAPFRFYKRDVEQQRMKKE